MTSPAGVADGGRPARWACLVTVPAVALVAVLLGPARALPAAHRAGAGTRPEAGALASGAAASAPRPASAGAAPAPAADTVALPAGPAVADLAAPQEAGAPAGGTGTAGEARRSGTSGGAASVPATAAPGPVDPARPAQTWAVIVGINRYPRGDHDLHTAVADARDVDDALAGYGVAGDHRVLLLDREATAPGIRA
ncbi:MAG: hypothetical protein LC792_14555, partial [Actinobacteria bacterium]|nr:hypothetical protein [Actinomycetota bacterium]